MRAHCVRQYEDPSRYSRSSLASRQTVSSSLLTDVDETVRAAALRFAPCFFLERDDVRTSPSIAVASFLGVAPAASEPASSASASSSSSFSSNCSSSTLAAATTATCWPGGAGARGSSSC